LLHKIRKLHKWIGLINSLFLLVIAGTGFLLALKSRVTWVRPEEKSGVPRSESPTRVSVDQAMEAAFGVGDEHLKTPFDVDRVDYRPKRNVFKVVAKNGYTEVQIDGNSGKVLQVAQRTDQFIEDLHDLSFFNDAMKDFVLPAVGLGLAALSLSGIYIYANPVLRRRRFEAEKKRSTPPPNP
jgi:uncharacterized iron-regulated membrane protein